MKRIDTALAVVTCLALLGCGGSGPSGAGTEPAPGAPAEGRRAGAITSGNAHYDNVVEMLRGKAPGLQIVEVSPGEIQIRVRGLNQSMQGGGQEPLVIIDGSPSGRPAGMTLMGLNPDDVASIEVLKDVSSTSVYGTRGANGVILVTTKRRDAPTP